MIKTPISVSPRMRCDRFTQARNRKNGRMSVTQQLISVSSVPPRHLERRQTFPPAARGNPRSLVGIGMPTLDTTPTTVDSDVGAPNSLDTFVHVGTSCRSNNPR